MSDGLWGDLSLAPGPPSSPVSAHGSDLRHRNTGLHLGWLPAPGFDGVSEIMLKVEMLAALRQRSLLRRLENRSVVTPKFF